MPNKQRKGMPTIFEETEAASQPFYDKDTLRHVSIVWSCIFFVGLSGASGTSERILAPK